MPNIVKRSSVAATSLVLAISLVLVAILALPSRHSAALARDGQAVSPPAAVQTSLVRLGFSADSMAAGGLTASDVPALWQALTNNASLANTCTSRESAVETARTTLDQLTRQMRRTGASPELRTQRQAASAALESARSSLSDAQHQLQVALCAAVSGGITQTDAAMLSRAVANAYRMLPGEYKVLDLTEPQWNLLISAIDHTTVASSQGVSPTLSDEESSILASANANSDVSLARSRIAQSGPAIEHAIAAAVTADADTDPH